VSFPTGGGKAVAWQVALVSRPRQPTISAGRTALPVATSAAESGAAQGRLARRMSDRPPHFQQQPATADLRPPPLGVYRTCQGTHWWTERHTTAIGD
jgi:hypothetical protein